MDKKTVRDAVELTDEAIGMVAGGEYGDLLAPVGAIEYVVCTVCGKVFTGAVTEIRPIGAPRQNATYFDVRITAPEGVTLLPGMNATITLGE